MRTRGELNTSSRPATWHHRRTLDVFESTIELLLLLLLSLLLLSLMPMVQFNAGSEGERRASFPPRRW